MQLGVVSRGHIQNIGNGGIPENVHLETSQMQLLCMEVAGPILKYCLLKIYISSPWGICVKILIFHLARDGEWKYRFSWYQVVELYAL